MVRRKIIWTTNAKITIQETLDFYKKRNGNTIYSKSILSKAKQYSQKLSEHPYLGIEVEKTEYRELLFDYFSLFYTIGEKEIFIKLFWDNRRNPKELEISLTKLL